MQGPPAPGAAVPAPTGTRGAPDSPLESSVEGGNDLVRALLGGAGETTGGPFEPLAAMGDTSPATAPGLIDAVAGADPFAVAFGADTPAGEDDAAAAGKKSAAQRAAQLLFDAPGDRGGAMGIAVAALVLLVAWALAAGVRRRRWRGWQ
jgi:hypothetical protein